MIDSKLAKMFLLHWSRIEPELKQDSDTDTLVAKWYVYFRDTVGWADWRPIYGHNVS